MNDTNAVFIAEGVTEVDTKEEMIEAWQHLVDTGLAWRLQGFFGRTASELIAQGILKETA